MIFSLKVYLLVLVFVMSYAASVLTTSNLGTNMPVSRTIEDFIQLGYGFFDQHRNKLFYVTATVTLAWIYNKFWVNRKNYKSSQTMRGKTVLITGANAGIGYETAKDLLQRGARVILVCRSAERGEKALRQLQETTHCGESMIRLMLCDLSSYQSVRDFAAQYNEEEQRLDVLICNAGIVSAPEKVTKDGFDTIIQSNYLGHFLLTNLLLDKLKACRPSRIINVSSGAHQFVRSIDWSDAFTQFKKSKSLGPYANSKAFQVLSTVRLKRDLLDSDVNTFSLHPGWVWTAIQSQVKGTVSTVTYLCLYSLARLLAFVFSKTPEIGALTTIYCAVEPKLEKSPDVYFENCAVSRASTLTLDEQLADRLWELSCQAVELQ